MTRPCYTRHVGFVPGATYFKPVGIRLRDLEEVVMTLDELEALRLADLGGLYQEEAAERMKISRATFARIIEVARKKTADALLHGKALRFQGGPVLHRSETDAPMTEATNKKGKVPMKAAISVKGSTLEDPIDAHFGRAQQFLLIDMNTGETSVFYNEIPASASHGVGARTAQQIAECGVNVVIAGRVGPKPFAALEAAGISVYLTPDDTAGGALERFRRNELERQDTAQRGCRRAARNASPGRGRRRNLKKS